ncbi:MAG TPA: hypothetical protein VGH96_15455 [Streptosporangiaceae bacterium]
MSGAAVKARKDGETFERSSPVSAWRDARYFSGAERAALALTEAVIRLSDRTDPVPDGIWDEAARHYDEKQLAALVVWIAAVAGRQRRSVCRPVEDGQVGFSDAVRVVDDVDRGAARPEYVRHTRATTVVSHPPRFSMLLEPDWLSRSHAS